MEGRVWNNLTTLSPHVTLRKKEDHTLLPVMDWVTGWFRVMKGSAVIPYAVRVIILDLVALEGVRSGG